MDSPRYFGFKNDSPQKYFRYGGGQILAVFEGGEANNPIESKRTKRHPKPKEAQKLHFVTLRGWTAMEVSIKCVPF